MDKARPTHSHLNARRLLRCVPTGALILLLALPAASFAQTDDPESGDAPAVEANEAKDDSLLDRQKDMVESSVNRAAQWVDSFFSDPNYEAESAQTLLRIRPELYYRDKQGLEARLKARVKFRLPNIDRKTSLVIGSDDAVDEFGDTVDDASEDPVIGLQFFGKKRENWKTSLSLGVKFNEFAGYIGPRFRYLAPWGDNRSVSLTQTIRYQTNAYWNTISRLDLNFVVGDRLFFRQTVDGRWRGEKSDEEGFRTRISSILTQRLKNGAGLQYDFSTFIHTRPQTQVDSYVLSVRYRQRTRRDWLYYEIVPQVSFEEEFDYAFNPGIRLRLEFFYGADSAAKFWKREHEDTDDFRW
jgi:hypothetical protein